MTLQQSCCLAFPLCFLESLMLDHKWLATSQSTTSKQRGCGELAQIQTLQSKFKNCALPRPSLTAAQGAGCSDGHGPCCWVSLDASGACCQCRAFSGCSVPLSNIAQQAHLALHLSLDWQKQLPSRQQLGTCQVLCWHLMLAAII